MKYNTLILALFLGIVTSVTINKSAGDEAAATAQADDLDALMDKYDDQEKTKNKPKPNPSTTTKNGVTVTKGEIQDAELRILQGNDMAQSSKKAYDDDLYNASIEKYATASKTDKDTNILTKENAMEACIDLFQSKDQIDQFDASDKVKKKFNKLWEEHDNLKNGFIDTTEAYTLMQDMSREE